MNMRTITVTLDIFTDPETGAEHVLPSAKELAEIEKQMWESEQEAARLLSSAEEEEKKQGRIRKQVCQRMREQYEKQCSVFSALREQAERRTYELKRPTYGEYLQAEAVAKELKDDGTIVVDQSRLMEALLPECVMGMSRQQVMQLPPNLAMTLWNRVHACMWPDNSRLPFCALPSRTSAEEH